MNPAEAERLLQECCDGTASPHERARLEAWLAEHPRGRERQAAIEALFAELGSVQPAAAPADLRERVLAEIRERASRLSPIAGPAARDRVRGRAPAHDSIFSRRPRVVAGFAFSVGLAAGALLLGLYTRNPATGAGDPRVSGAMGSATPARIEAVALRLEDAQVMARAWEEGATCQVQIELTLPPGVTAELTDPTGAREPVAMRRVGGPAASIRVDRGGFAWTSASGSSYRAVWGLAPGTPGPLQLTLTSTGGSSHAELPVSISTRRQPS